MTRPAAFTWPLQKSKKWRRCCLKRHESPQRNRRCCAANDFRFTSLIWATDFSNDCAVCVYCAVYWRRESKLLCSWCSAPRFPQLLWGRMESEMNTASQTLCCLCNTSYRTSVLLTSNLHPTVKGVFCHIRMFANTWSSTKCELYRGHVVGRQTRPSSRLNIKC